MSSAQSQANDTNKVAIESNKNTEETVVKKSDGKAVMPPIKKKITLLSDKFKGAEYARNIWSATSAVGVALEDVLKPEYWAHVAMKLTPSDRIEVVAEDGSFFAELYVQDKDKTWAKVFLLRHVVLDPLEKIDPTLDFKVDWRGPANRYGVIRKSDNTVIKDGFATKGEAARFIDTYSRSMAG